MSKKLGDFLGAVLGGIILGKVLRQVQEPGAEPKGRSTSQHGQPPSQDTIHQYKPFISPYGGLAVKVGDYTVGSVFDTPTFQASLDQFPNWISKPQLEVALALEEIVREGRKHLGPRHYSGLDQHAHIRNNLDVYLKNCMRANVRPDVIAAYVTIGIDLVEDASLVIQLLKDWEKAIINHDEQRRLEIEKELRDCRASVIYGARTSLTQLVTHMSGINIAQKHQHGREVYDSFRLIGHVTRHPEERPYPLSMAFQFARRPNERLIQTLRRALAKMADKTSNILEYHPMDKLEKVGIAFNDDHTIVDGYRLGEELQRRYGAINKDAKPMPGSVRTQNGFTSLFVPQFLNEMLDDIELQIPPNTREAELLRVVKYSRHIMIQSVMGLLNSTYAIYEPHIPQEIKDAIDSEIAQKKRGNFYYTITPDGFVIEWLGHDVAGRRVIEALDNSPEQRIRTYEVARDLGVVIPMFDMFHEKGRRDLYRPVLITDPNVKFDPRIHAHFTLDGVDRILEYVQGPKYRDLAARQLYKKQLLERNGRSS